MNETLTLNRTRTSFRASRVPARMPWHSSRSVDVVTAIAGLGLGATIAMAITAESWSALNAPGGWLTFGGRHRRAGRDVSDAHRGSAGGPRPGRGADARARRADALAPPACSMDARADRCPRNAHHVRLCGERQDRGAASVRPAADHLSGHPHGHRRIRAARDGRIHVGADRQAADALRDLVGRPPLHVSGARAVLLPPARQRGVMFVGHPLERVFWTALFIGTAGVVFAYRILLPIWRSTFHQLRVAAVQPEGPGVVSRPARGQAPAAHADRRWPVHPAADPQARTVVAGAPLLGVGAAGRPLPARSRSRTSATTAAGSLHSSPAHASRSRARTAPSRVPRARVTAS